jgi:arginase
MVKHLSFLGLGFEVGQTRSGLAWSPQYAKKYFALLRAFNLQVWDCGYISSPNFTTINKIYSDKEIAAFNWRPYKDAYLQIRKLLQKDRLLINWGGDHSVGLATVGAFCREFSDGYVLWIDAHADLNLPEVSLTGNLHGMPLSILLNLQKIQKRNFQWLAAKLDPSKLIYVGLRDLDPFEKEIINQYNIKNYDIELVRKLGMASIAIEIKNHIGGRPLHVSFDIDCLDPALAPATGLCVPEGLSLQDLEILGTNVLPLTNLKSVDVVEVNPLIGSSYQVEKTFFAAFNFLKTIQAIPIKGGSYDAIGRSNQTKHSSQVESSLQF